MATQDQTVVQREAPEIEARKLGLMDQAKTLTSAPPTGGLPAITVQGPSALEQQAFTDAAGVGVGAYSPYLTTAQGTQTAAGQMYQAGAVRLLHSRYNLI